MPGSTDTTQLSLATVPSASDGVLPGSPLTAAGNFLFPVSYFSRAKAICLILLWHDTRRADSRAAWTAGRSNPINTAMIATTTSSSTSVNP
jgi:hypothetical protein